jgi:hypothetical protein
MLIIAARLQCNVVSMVQLLHVCCRRWGGIFWKGSVGYVTRDMLAAHMPAASAGSDALIMVCGPPGTSHRRQRRPLRSAACCVTCNAGAQLQKQHTGTSGRSTCLLRWELHCRAARGIASAAAVCCEQTPSCKPAHTMQCTPSNL